MGEVTYTPIAEINGEADYVNIRGCIIYRSDVESYHGQPGLKLCLDIADESGEIRVFGWQRMAEDGGILFQLNQFVEMRNLAVHPRHPRYNSLPHPYQLILVPNHITGVDVLDDSPPSIAVYEDVDFGTFAADQVNCDPYSEVRNSQHPDFSYFTVAGRVVDIDPPRFGLGKKGNSWKRDIIVIKDEEGDFMKVAIKNGYIPVSRNIIGQTLKVIRGKYIRDHEVISTTRARIEIDRVRVI